MPGSPSSCSQGWWAIQGLAGAHTCTCSAVFKCLHPGLMKKIEVLHKTFMKKLCCEGKRGFPFLAMTNLTSKVLLFDTAPHALILLLFDSVLFIG
eukprot:1158418-Pelagomonas_calceolata.AAC.15